MIGLGSDKNVKTLSACQSFEGLWLSNPSCKCLFPIARSCIGTERAAVEQLGSGSCPVWSLNTEVWGDVYLNWDIIQQISIWLLSGEMSVQLDYSLRIEGTTTQYSNTLLTRNARPLPCHISNLAQVLLHKMNWTMQIKTMRRFLSNKIIWTGGVTSMYNWCPVRCLSKWPTPPLLFSSRPLHWNWWTHTEMVSNEPTFHFFDQT